MTTTETFGGPVPPPTAPPRRLRRNRTSRVGAGVAGGLGEYFGVDPVLFRVLFATAAFFGGAGILAYLIAWAAIPEDGTEHAPIDGWMAALRRHRVPVWIVAVIGGLLLWAIAFSWWAPGPFFPVVAVVVLLVVFLGRRDLQASRPAPPAPAPSPSPSPPPVDLSKPGPAAASGEPPNLVRDARAWLAESAVASRARRRRALPIRIATLVTLALALVGLAIADSVAGVQLQAYFWTGLGIVVAGLLAGLVSRRFSVSLLPLLIFFGAGTVAFAGSHASLSDGIGSRAWTPTALPASSSYRLAFGKGVLDLRSLPRPTSPARVDITMAAGQVRVLVPKSYNVTVSANVHLGDLRVDRHYVGHGSDHGGVGVSRTVLPAARAKGGPVTVDVHLADGQIDVERY